MASARLFALLITTACAGVLIACDGGGDDDDDAGSRADSGTPRDAGQPDGGQAPALRDVTLSITGAGPHVDQLVEIRIVNPANQLVVRGVIDPLPSAAYMFELPNSTPAGAHRLDFFADLNEDRDYDAPPADHAWRENVGASGDVTVAFAHNTNFTDIASPAITQAGEFVFNANNMDPHMDQLFELRVIRTDTGQLVGRYVLDAVADSDFTLRLPGIIQNGVQYRVDYYADLSNNNDYNAPPADHAWRDTFTGTASGATVDFTHNTNFTDVQF